MQEIGRDKKIIMEMPPKKNTFIIDTLKYIPVKVLPAFAGLLSIYILTGHFSEKNYIDYTFVISSVLLVGQLFNGWLNSTIMYFFPSCKTENEEKNLTKVFFTLLFFLQLLGIITIFTTVYIGMRDVQTALVSALLFVFQGYITFFTSILQSKRMIKAQVLSTTIQASLQMLGLILMVFFFKDNFHLYLWCFLGSFVFSLGVLLIHKKSKVSLLLHQLDREQAKKILQYSLPICIWIFSVQFYSTGDRILFKYLNVSENVVNYIAFKDLAIGLSSFISMPLLFASHPIIMNLAIKERDTQGAIAIIERNINILLLIFLPCILVVYFYGDMILGTFLGDKYLLSPVMMMMILLTVLFSCISIYLQKGLEVNFLTRYMLKLALFVAVFSGIFNVVFIPMYGVLASIILGLLSQVLYSLLVILKSQRMLPINFKSLHLLFFVTAVGISLFLKEWQEVHIFNYIIPLFIAITILFSIKKLKVKDLL